VVVETMHQRKYEMFQRSDAFVVLPGGIGTFTFSVRAPGAPGTYKVPVRLNAVERIAYSERFKKVLH